MAFKVTKWEYSNEVSGKWVLPDEGDCYVKIVSARYDEKGDQYGPKYTIQLLDLHKEGTFTLDYRPDGDSKAARSHKGSLISLGEALAGSPIGRPNPVDIVGGVVVAEITHKIGDTLDKEGNPRIFPRCYKFKAAPKDIVEGFSDIEQNYLEEDDVGEESE